MKLLWIYIFIPFLLFAQEENFELTKSLNFDTQIALSKIKFDKDNSVDGIYKKKPIISALLSFAVPGAGQVYNGDYLKAGILLAVDIAAIVIAVKYNNKGDDQTEFYENYANENWSAAQYAEWTLNNLQLLNPDLNPNNYNVFDNNGKVIWTELNKLEGDIGWYYSHRLAPYGEQQYYEMIGKYSQFNVGWKEFGDADTPYVWNVDPLTDQFKWYSKQRGKANDYYTVAKWGTIAVFTNHILSAIEAAWTTAKNNKKLNAKVTIEKQEVGFYYEYYPKLNLNYRL